MSGFSRTLTWELLRVRLKADTTNDRLVTGIRESEQEQYELNRCYPPMLEPVERIRR